jgi:transcription antitermination protein NusB
VPSVLNNPARRTARERALEVLYEADMKSLSVGQVLASLPVAPDPYAVDLVTGVAQHQQDLDRVISGLLKSGWSMQRLPTVDRLVLRLGTEELCHHHDVPAAVVLDESVRLAKGFSTDDSGRFVNGVLASVAKQVRTGPDSQAVASGDLSDDDQPTPAFDPVFDPAVHRRIEAGIAFEDEPATLLDS